MRSLAKKSYTWREKYGTFCLQEITPTPSSGSERGGFLDLMINMFKDGNTCPKFTACSSDTLSMLLSPVLSSFKYHTFLCLFFVICPLISHWVGYPCLISHEIYHFNGKSVSLLIKIFKGPWINLRGVAPQVRPTKWRRISDTGLIVSLLERNIDTAALIFPVGW